jgi:hypothetical protein
MSLGQQIILKARKQATELDYSMEEALADILGGLLFEVDAVLQLEYKSYSLESDVFHKNFNSHVVSFSRQKGKS